MTPPPPLPKASVSPHPEPKGVGGETHPPAGEGGVPIRTTGGLEIKLGSWGGEPHSLAGKGVEGPNSDEGTETLVLYANYNLSMTGKLSTLIICFPMYALYRSGNMRQTSYRTQVTDKHYWNLLWRTGGWSPDFPLLIFFLAIHSSS